MLECSGMISFIPWFTVIYAPVMIFASHIDQKTNAKCDLLEQKTAEGYAMNFEVEKMKIKAKLYGPMWNSLGFSNIYTGIITEESDSLAIGIGHSLRGASYYVMRADYIQPRKNCFRRGIDKLSEIVEQYKAKPMPAPLPA